MSRSVALRSRKVTGADSSPATIRLATPPDMTVVDPDGDKLRMCRRLPG
jgi:hypothetical protein